MWVIFYLTSNRDTKYPCFICLRDKAQHWVKKDWSLRSDMAVGQKNIVDESLVDREKILLPALHIILGIINQYVKALDKDGGCFQYICNKFPGLSYKKATAGIFDGPHQRYQLYTINE